MITLYSFGPHFGLPDPSPFVVKAEMLLKLSGLPFQKVIGNMRKAPKGKLPYIDDAGTVVADSTLIRLHIEKQYGLDLSQGLSAEQKAIAWSIDCMCGDHLYWCVVQERWMDDAVFARGPAIFFKAIPAPLRALIVPMIRRKVKRNLEGQGLGRFTQVERDRLLDLDVQSLSDLLGDKPYMFGDHPTWIDATVFAFVSSCLTPVLGETPSHLAMEKRANLVAYAARLKQQYYADAPSV